MLLIDSICVLDTDDGTIPGVDDRGGGGEGGAAPAAPAGGEKLCILSSGAQHLYWRHLSALKSMEIGCKVRAWLLDLAPIHSLISRAMPGYTLRDTITQRTITD